MFDIVIAYGQAIWDILLEASPYVLLGFFVAGLLKGFLPKDMIGRHLGHGRFLPVIKAALFGVPLPLCSCGVIPAAAGLRQQGASRGATTSFLISTPETGVDSIAVSFALLDPITAVIRPVAAFFTAIVTGSVVASLPEKIQGAETAPLASSKAPAATVKHEGHGCCSTHTKPMKTPLIHLATYEQSDATKQAGCTCGSGKCSTAPQQESPSFRARFVTGMRFGFGDLVSDIGKWLLLGILLAGGITTLIPDTFFVDYLGGGLTSMLVMLVVGIPLYVCATASTPVAAAMALKGLSPGAALVFLLAGPATNVATITVVAKLLGRNVAAIYVLGIATCSILLGLAVNALYAYMGLSITSWVAITENHAHSIFDIAAAVALLALLIYRLLPRRKNAGGGHCAHGH